ncbi:SufS family cysteine desulfurase [Rhodovastum atsumiense]|uniref:cysteine desulfurase n=2 Tax=Rhodovastum atsumiense TaxID=504468 RepID=A0A5M6IZI8_9PROT|nr:SufS family cysteine desulfurase [Rhodovastum atsumiense]
MFHALPTSPGSPGPLPSGGVPAGVVPAGAPTTGLPTTGLPRTAVPTGAFGGPGVSPASTPLPDAPDPGLAAPGIGGAHAAAAPLAARVPPPLPRSPTLPGVTAGPATLGGIGLAPPSAPLPAAGPPVPPGTSFYFLDEGHRGAAALPDPTVPGASGPGPSVPDVGQGTGAALAAAAPLTARAVPALPPVPALPGVSGPPGAQGGFGAPPPASPLPVVPALGPAIPGQEALQALLMPALPPPQARPAPSPGGPTPSLYFLQDLDGGGVPAGAMPASTPGAGFDPHSRRGDFPILAERVNGRRLVWLDNGATTQKPRAVIERLVRFYEHENSNIHRAAHELAARATDAYEGAREVTRRFLNASAPEEIVFVRGTTEGINLVAQSWGRRFIGAGDEIVITWLEHHANIVPWQMLAEQTGAKLKVAPVDDDGQVVLDAYANLLGPRTKLVALTQVSNALGTITPAQAMTAMAHAVGARVLIDGAQSVAHMRTDVQALGCDWFVFSGHKVFGPTGIGAVYGRRDVLAETPPWQGGGNMIRDVTFEYTEYQDPPARFEAGTGNIADAVGLGAALDYVQQAGLEAIGAHEHALLEHALHDLAHVPGLRLFGTAAEKAGVISFVIDGLDTQEIGKALNREGIAVRAGHHCAQPILRRFGVEATVRASLALYNTHDDVDALVAAVRRIRTGITGLG